MTSSNQFLPETCDVAVVGGGPSGLALAAELKRIGVSRVIVLEREKEAGGVPRHCGHYPFGIREYGRLLKGPEYAKRNVQTARSLGVDIRTEASVTALHPGGRVSLSTPVGCMDLQAERVVLCTGVRESSRAQRLIGGDRVQGIMPTGALQSMVYLQRIRPFRRPVILGSELVSFSAVETCRHLGIRAVAMIEEQDRIVARRIFEPYLRLRRVRLILNAGSPRVLGRQKVEAVEYIDALGESRRIETDGVIVSGRFRPESALLRSSHLEVDPGSGGPVVDQYGQCSDPIYYSAGNLLRPAETSGWCWHEGIATARRAAQDMSSSMPMIPHSVRFEIADPAIRFVVPQRLTISKRPGEMDKLQIALQEPAKGRFEATVEDHGLFLGRIDSRPVRRIRMPIKEILSRKPKKPVRLSIRRSE